MNTIPDAILEHSSTSFNEFNDSSTEYSNQIIRAFKPKKGKMDFLNPFGQSMVENPLVAGLEESKTCIRSIDIIKNMAKPTSYMKGVTADEAPSAVIHNSSIGLFTKFLDTKTELPSNSATIAGLSEQSEACKGGIDFMKNLLNKTTSKARGITGNIIPDTI